MKYPRLIGRKFTCTVCGQTGRNIAIGPGQYERTSGSTHVSCLVKIIEESL